MGYGKSWHAEISPLRADRLVRVVGLTVGKEVVDDHAYDREEEDDQGPDDLARHRAIRLEDLDYGTYVSSHATRVGSRTRQAKLTPCNNIEYKDNKSDDTATSPCLPGLRALNSDGSSLDEEEHRQLEKGGENVIEHLDSDVEIGAGV